MISEIPRSAMSRMSALASVLLLASLVMLLAESALAQSPNATLTGTVVDASGAVVPGAQLSLLNQDTSLTHDASSGDNGMFAFASLPPGRYTLVASKTGFASTEMRELVLSVGDRTEVRVTLEVAPIGETTTVISEVRRVSTSAAVGTVIDRQFVENLPLNGRSLQSLLELTPGVVPAPAGSGFSVNGQRSSANYFTIDGASANVGVTGGAAAFPGQALSGGQTPAQTALGTTSGLISVDALQEFRVATSTYAPEFGRMPGGQVSLVTRSGTNLFHGTLFDYIRHDALDARDWFMNYRALAKPKLRQHDYGFVLGGAVVRNQTFFFVSYEGLRLEQPKALLTSVPSLQTRATAAPVLRRYIDALPRPNGADSGNGLAEFSASWSDTSRIDSTSVRVDHNARRGLLLFARVSHAPTYSESRVSALSTIARQNQRNTSTTAGATWTLSSRMVNDLRVNYTKTSAPYDARLDDFGGAIVPDASVFEANRTADDTLFSFGLGGSNFSIGRGTDYAQTQWNVVDSLTVVTKGHETKFGLDIRRNQSTISNGSSGQQSMTAELSRLPSGTLLRYFISGYGSEPVVATFDNISLYAQDSWRLIPRLTLTYGIRWELVPPPRSRNGENPIALDNLDNLFGGMVRVASRDKPLWETRYNNVAPRIGGTYVVSQRQGSELVLKSGFGIFHDLGYGVIANAFAAYPFRLERSIPNAVLPLRPEQTADPLPGERPASLTMSTRDLKLPSSYQWNVAVEQALGSRQTVSASYVGAHGRDLLKLSRYNIPIVDWGGIATTAVTIGRNRGYSRYDALQLQYQRRMHRGIQMLASYTYGHARDTGSGDTELTTAAELVPPSLTYGDSDFDIRHVFTTAITFQLPSMPGGRWVEAASKGWAMDAMLRARSAEHVRVGTTVLFGSESVVVRPNTVSGQSFWIEDDDAPGGRRLNAAAFTIPPDGTQGNLPRGAVRGFPLRQLDLALRRDVAVYRRVRLQLRVELFNLLNTPMFSSPNATLFPDAAGNPAFVNNGASSNTLNKTLGGLNALYQVGGARSSQLSFKLLF